MSSDSIFLQHQQVLKDIAEATEQVGLLELDVENPNLQLSMAAMVTMGDPRAMARKKLEAKKLFLDTKIADERELRELLDQQRQNTALVQVGVERLRWKGHLHQLAGLAADLHERGYIDTQSKEEAFEQIAAHFTGPDGQSLSAPSLRNNLKQKKDKEIGKVRA